MDNKLKDIYNEKNNLWGLPQVYKGINFYPILLKDTRSQDLFYQIFQYPQSYIPDKKILKMSYLKYLLYIIEYSIKPQGTFILDGLTELLQNITKQKKIEFTYQRLNVPGDNIDKLAITLHIGSDNNSVDFTEQDFDIIRAIILEQNGIGVDYIEEFNPELEERLKFSDNSLGDVSFEEEIWVFCTLLKCPIDDISEYTLYQFRKHFERLIMLSNYELYAPLETGGTISSKSGEKITKHFMMHVNKPKRYDSILISAASFLDKHPDIPDKYGKTRDPIFDKV